MQLQLHMAIVVMSNEHRGQPRASASLLPATLSLLSVIKNDVCEYLAQRLKSSDVVFDLCADGGIGVWGC